jgi:hypothetical protein
MSVRPIQTEYKGRLFRSRLEARWAVFFETANIRWEYEPEGYWVSDEPYLPDFFLPDIRMMIDVKPYGFFERNPDDPDRVKMSVIQSIWNAAESNLPKLWVLEGNPRNGEYFMYSGDGEFDESRIFTRCRRCDDICYIMTYGIHQHGEDDWCGWGELGETSCGNEKWPTEKSLEKELRRASMARFEHGEAT